ncbi:MAG: nuclear transport factor 2 family protein [marine benthic group bacterium]|nr:nuclear transport factor 2 family protein [Candidatus Carthagonibacter metallireducens]
MRSIIDPVRAIYSSRFLALALPATVLPALAFPVGAEAQVTTELDAYWAEGARTVAEGDFEGYAKIYHPDAVLVVGGSGSYPIATALAGWKPGFDDTLEGRAEAGVEFRLTERLVGETTAHETGIFRYFLRPEEGEEQIALIHFEALLVKKDGRWLMLMEYQKGPATDAEWAAAG